MDEKWLKLVEQFENAGYSPRDIQRMVMVYETAKINDEKFKNLPEDEQNED